MITHTPLAVANAFIANFGAERGVEHMKLQKLVYFTHGWWLAYHSESLLSEKPQVWRHGPVFASLYHTLKQFGHTPITFPQSVSPWDGPDMLGADNYLPQLIYWVWGRYGHLSSFGLSDITHRAGTSWSQLAEQYGFQTPKGLEIPDEYVRAEFMAQLEAERTVNAAASA